MPIFQRVATSKRTAYCPLQMRQEKPIFNSIVKRTVQSGLLSIKVKFSHCCLCTQCSIIVIEKIAVDVSICLSTAVSASCCETKLSSVSSPKPSEE